jgi:hypothetical protein
MVMEQPEDDELLDDEELDELEEGQGKVICPV